MLVNDLRSGGSTVLVLGTDDVGLALGKALEGFGNSVFFWDGDRDSGVYRRFINSTLTALEDIDSYPLESVDCLILSQKLFSGDEEFMERFGRRIKKLEGKVFLDIEIVKILFHGSRLMAIVGDSYAKIVHGALDCIFENSPRRAILLPSEMNLPEIGRDESDGGLNLQGDNLFLMNLTGQILEYLGNIDFDIVAILSLGAEGQSTADVERFLSKQAMTGIAIINLDDEGSREFWNGPRFGSGSTVLIPLSTDKMIENGYSYVNETIYNYYDSNSSHDLTNDRLVGSKINKLSILSSFVAATRFGLDPLAVTTALRFFQGTAGRMECVRQSDGVIFINNVCAETMDILESPFDMYNAIHAIFLANGRVGEAMIRPRDYRDKLKSVFLIDAFDMFDLDAAEFGELTVKKAKDIREAVAAIGDIIDSERREEEESALVISPIHSDRMNSSYYESLGDEFRRIVRGL
ncbi:MAG: hypothetical protein LBU15_04710 [Rickettsiales bacterium]|jgi:UDP-N-acetylmuramoylalanine-D-glutamate ligase|nr:hypothetical protein [Rickettsiales bacterium]